LSFGEKVLNKNKVGKLGSKHGLVLLGAGLLLSGSLPAIAHHAFAAEFDGDKPLDLTGIVTKARWVNPHSWLFFDVKAPDGTVTNWGVELAAPNALASKGVTKADLATGSQVQVKGFLSKNGGAFGYAVSITLPDGRSFETGGAPNTPAAPPGPGGAAARPTGN
jgi:Family of unknown function (DUF6152)